MVKSLLNVGAVLPAAGVGYRFGEKKQLKHLANKPLFIYALDVFVKCKEIAEIVVVANQNDIEYVLKEVESFKHKKPIKNYVPKYYEFFFIFPISKIEDMNYKIYEDW